MSASYRPHYSPGMGLGITVRRVPAAWGKPEYLTYVCVRCVTDGHSPNTWPTVLEARLHTLVCPYWGDVADRP